MKLLSRALASTLILTLVIFLYFVYDTCFDRATDTPAFKIDNPVKESNFHRNKALQQKIIDNFCSLFLPSSIPGFNVTFGGINIVHSPQFGLNYSVYATSDIVSEQIAEGGWETSLVTQAIKALKQISKTESNPNPIFLDIGANVGFFSLSVAGAGFDVISFEPMRENSLLIQKTICDNPVLDKKITLFNKGLGTEEETCWIFSDPLNTGDGHVQCKERPKTDYIIRGMIETVRLDDYIDDPEIRSRIGVVKMDVEGYEHNVIRGGMDVLLSGSIPYIQTEFAKNMMPGKGGNLTEFLQSFYDAGYTAKKDFFSKGKGYTQDQVFKMGLNELFFVHESVVQLEEDLAQ